MIPKDNAVKPDEYGLVWDVRDKVGYDFAVGATIDRLLNEGYWNDLGITLRYAANSLMQPYLNRLAEEEKNNAVNGE